MFTVWNYLILKNGVAVDIFIISTSINIKEMNTYNKEELQRTNK